MASVNAGQVGGTHYKKKVVVCFHCKTELQHWDIYKSFSYLEGTITKYLWRWVNKGGVEDLLKARHYLDKLIEVAQSTPPPQKPSTPSGISDV
jgi:Protein of unknwon function (DUF3310)